MDSKYWEAEPVLIKVAAPPTAAHLLQWFLLRREPAIATEIDCWLASHHFGAINSLLWAPSS